jgi:pilus assembly protein Flp/PilA
MSGLYNASVRFLKDENGASLVEYSILIGLITVATIGLISIMGTRITAYWQSLVNATS